MQPRGVRAPMLGSRANCDTAWPPAVAASPFSPSGLTGTGRAAGFTFSVQPMSVSAPDAGSRENAATAKSLSAAVYTLLPSGEMASPIAPLMPLAVFVQAEGESSVDVQSEGLKQPAWRIV